MLTSGFTDTPLARSLVFGVVVTSFFVSVTDKKHYFYILADPHIWSYGQTWRALIYQLCYTNSSEVLFAAIILYNLRVIERLWGSRKFGSFILVTYGLTSLLPPLILTLILRPLLFNKFNYLPAGFTPVIFALLAQYHAAIPRCYKYRLAFSESPTPASVQHSNANSAPPTFIGLTFSDKSYTYLLATQLALSQFPGSLFSAGMGWIVGYIWRNDALPVAVTNWRIPGRLFGLRSKRGEGFEGLRRRLEGEDGAAATGSDGRQRVDATRRRTMGRQILDQFRGVF